MSIVGEKDTGKTTMIVQLIKRLREYGKIGCIKHAEHLDISTSNDSNGESNSSDRGVNIVIGGRNMKDTERMLAAGADVVVGISSDMMIRMRRREISRKEETMEATIEKIEMHGTADMLSKSLDVMRREGVDFVIVEGFKRSKIPKIVINSGGDAFPYENVIMRLPPHDAAAHCVSDIVRMIRALADR